MGSFRRGQSTGGIHKAFEGEAEGSIPGPPLANSPPCSCARLGPRGSAKDPYKGTRPVSTGVVGATMATELSIIYLKYASTGAPIWTPNSMAMQGFVSGHPPKRAPQSYNNSHVVSLGLRSQRRLPVTDWRRAAAVSALDATSSDASKLHVLKDMYSSIRYICSQSHAVVVVLYIYICICIHMHICRYRSPRAHRPPLGTLNP